jgi:hypothetical protein
MTAFAHFSAGQYRRAFRSLDGSEEQLRSQLEKKFRLLAEASVPVRAES